MTSPHKESSINPPVFFTSGGLLIALLVFTVYDPIGASQYFKHLQSIILDSSSWFFILSVTLIFGFALWLALGPHGQLRLGADDDRPEYSRFSWYSMLFAAGMGIGLVFYGVAEPMSHYRNPPVGDPESLYALKYALPLTFHHWGLHAWAVYAVIGLSIAYFAYRKRLPLTLRSCFYPIFGERIHGWIGHSIDILAVFGTLFGLATSLGAGAGSVSAGFSRLFGTPDTITTQLVIIGVITLAATISLVTGVDKGIKLLSEANMIIAGLLLLFVFLVGPTIHILNSFVQSVGTYASEFINRSFNLGYQDPKEFAWVKGWSAVYWAWWIAWAPFVGMFVARISRGRTLRDFVLSVMFVPVGVTFLWFSVFGGTALSSDHRGAVVTAIKEAGKSADAVAVYSMLEGLPMGSVLCFLAAVVVTIFFISSSDSASFVVDMLTSGGHPDPPTWQRVFWATAEGATAAIMLKAGGLDVLAGLKAGVVAFGLPFTLLVLLMCYALLKSLRSDSSAASHDDEPALTETPSATVSSDA